MSTEKSGNLLTRLPEMAVIGALAVGAGWLIRDNAANTIKEMKIEKLEARADTFEKKLKAREGFMQCAVTLEAWRDGGGQGQKPCTLEVKQ